MKTSDHDTHHRENADGRNNEIVDAGDVFGKQGSVDFDSAAGTLWIARADEKIRAGNGHRRFETERFALVKLHVQTFGQFGCEGTGIRIRTLIAVFKNDFTASFIPLPKTKILITVLGLYKIIYSEHYICICFPIRFPRIRCLLAPFLRHPFACVKT